MTRNRSGRNPRRDAPNVPTAEGWMAAKPIIEDLYIQQDLPLHQVQDAMKRHGFIARFVMPVDPSDLVIADRGSERMYKGRLSSWGFCKNAKRKDWQDFAIRRHQRQATGEPFLRLEIHGKIKNEKDFRDYLKLQNVSEEDFVREAIASSTNVSAHKRYRDSPSLVFAASSVTGTGTQQKTHADQIHKVQAKQDVTSVDPYLLAGEALLTPTRLPAVGSAVSPPGWETISVRNAMEYEAPSSGPTTICQPKPNWGSDIHGPVSFQGPVSFRGPVLFQGQAPLPGGLAHTMALPDYLSQAIEPEAGIMPVGPPYSDFGGMLGQILCPRFQEAAVGNFGYETGGYYAFMSDTMMACICAASKEFAYCGQWLEKASLELQNMCNSLDQPHLVTLSTVLVWLQVHDQGSGDGSIGIAESLMREYSRTAISTLGKDASVCVILEWMTAVAGKNLADCGVTSDMLQQVWVEYRNVLGHEHPNTIVARYCLAFHLIKVDQSYAEAEVHLRWAHEAAVKVFGISHLQTLNILATLSRAQFRQGKLAEALETIRRCVNEEPLGQNHPHRLMLLRRMAIICKRLGMSEEREKLYWIVVEGRAATLGAQHETTKSAYNSLVQILKEAGKWDSAKEQAEKLLSEPHVAVSGYETWWHSMVEQGQTARERRSFSEETE